MNSAVCGLIIDFGFSGGDFQGGAAGKVRDGKGGGVADFESWSGDWLWSWGRCGEREVLKEGEKKEK